MSFLVINLKKISYGNTIKKTKDIFIFILKSHKTIWIT